MEDEFVEDGDRVGGQGLAPPPANEGNEPGSSTTGTGAGALDPDGGKELVTIRGTVPSKNSILVNPRQVGMGTELQ